MGLVHLMRHSKFHQEIVRVDILNRLEKRTHLFDQGDAIAQVYPLTTFIGLNQPISMMKVDTEGNELNVIQGSVHYFSNRLIKNAIVEVTPGGGFWDSLKISRSEVADAFANVASYGYKLVSLWDWKIVSSPEEVRSFVMLANFTQSDVWLTLEVDILESLSAIKG